MPAASLPAPGTQSDRFYSIWRPLLQFVSRSEDLRSTVDFLHGEYLPMEDVVPVRDLLWSRPELLERFVGSHRDGLSEADRALVLSWKHRVKGKFIIVRHKKDHSVFLGGDEENRGVYAVHPLLSPFEEVVGPYLPRAVEGVLLPFEGRIAYDGLLSTFNFSFGPGIRRTFLEDYEKALSRDGLITSLPRRTGAAEPSERLPHIRRRNRKLLEGFRRGCYRGGLSSRTVEKEVAWVSAFAEGPLLHENPPRGLDDLTEKDAHTLPPAPPQGTPAPSPEAWARAVGRFRGYLEERPFL
ncbi:MAG: hypothetical protein KGI98_07725 [Euryarchaeota archaeon]|nr:hypothetical protein [Euryarchaeota archaeon]